MKLSQDATAMAMVGLIHQRQMQVANKRNVELSQTFADLSANYFVKTTGKSIATIKRRIKALKDEGYIHVGYRKVRNGHSAYRLSVNTKHPVVSKNIDTLNNIFIIINHNKSHSTVSKATKVSGKTTYAHSCENNLIKNIKVNTKEVNNSTSCNTEKEVEITTQREGTPTPQKKIYEPKLRKDPTYQTYEMEGIAYKANSKTLYEIKEYLESKFGAVIILSKVLASWIHGSMKKFKKVENFKRYVEENCYGEIRNVMGFIKHLLKFEKINEWIANAKAGLKRIFGKTKFFRAEKEERREVMIERETATEQRAKLEMLTLMKGVKDKYPEFDPDKMSPNEAEDMCRKMDDSDTPWYIEQIYKIKKELANWIY